MRVSKVEPDGQAAPADCEATTKLVCTLPSSIFTLNTPLTSALRQTPVDPAAGTWVITLGRGAQQPALSKPVPDGQDDSCVYPHCKPYVARPFCVSYVV